MTDNDKIKLTVDGYNQIAAMWDGTRRRNWTEVTEIIITEIQKLNVSSNILDVGCGNARVLDEISEALAIKSIKYFGIDPSESLITIAQSRYAKTNASFAVCDASNPLPFGEGWGGDAFDLIISTAVLHHVPRGMQKHWLLQVASLAKANSKLIFTIWHRSSDAQSFDIEKEEVEGFAQLENIRYIYNFEKDELLSLFATCGLEVEAFTNLKRPNSNNENWLIVANKSATNL